MGDPPPEPAHKCFGIDCILVCHPLLLPCPGGQNSNSHVRKQNSSVVCHQPRWHSLDELMQGRHGALGRLHSNESTPLGGPYAWETEHTGGQTQQRRGVATRVGTELKIPTTPLPALGVSGHRCFCKLPEFEVQVFLQQRRRRSRIAGGRSSSMLGREVRLSFPTYSPTCESHHETPSGEAPNHPDSSMVASASLVLHTQPNQCSLLPIPTPGQPATGRSGSSNPPQDATPQIDSLVYHPRLKARVEEVILNSWKCLTHLSY